MERRAITHTAYIEELISQECKIFYLFLNHGISTKQMNISPFSFWTFLTYATSSVLTHHVHLAAHHHVLHWLKLYIMGDIKGLTAQCVILGWMWSPCDRMWTRVRIWADVALFVFTGSVQKKVVLFICFALSMFLSKIFGTLCNLHHMHTCDICKLPSPLWWWWSSSNDAKISNLFSLLI